MKFPRKWGPYVDFSEIKSSIHHHMVHRRFGFFYCNILIKWKRSKPPVGGWLNFNIYHPYYISLPPHYRKPKIFQIMNSGWDDIIKLQRNRNYKNRVCGKDLISLTSQVVKKISSIAGNPVHHFVQAHAKKSCPNKFLFTYSGPCDEIFIQTATYGNIHVGNMNNCRSIQ